ncbi:unnamed protein product [Zymoseptoria tritici ST99CH_1E4]|uniref:SET domain-containing protein n=2 Tax=Zymoseptoria tritici TaxID=1047171 RepID=F9X9T3_ZYMTI|nr:uncharacterized protein MYCGRDRAFT_85907 [Zymoseptoria tritici IPO323]EGP88158.1 hypothetical protein MYCGRDRAFT_85907 [Zymoseptoria tritici IPO323]SMR51386.1 unnamed protein product [Zymoseptoria tritici ST99CH_1E4]
MSPSFRIQDVAGKGTGVTASENIATGTLILAERPLITFEQEAQQDAYVRSILSQLKQMPNADQKDFFALSNNFKAMKPIEGIVKTNAMPLGRGSSSGGVFPTCSRFNHSCTANAAYSWNEGQKEERVYATRDISAGEEIVVSYLNEEIWRLPRQERKRQILETFGFDCQCVRCGSSEQPDHLGSDRRRTRLAEIDQAVGGGMLIMLNPGKALSFCREARQLLEDEGEGATHLESVYYDAFQICVCHGDLARAKVFASLAADAKCAWQGVDAGGIGEYEANVRAPEAHRLAFTTKKWFTVGKAGAMPPVPHTDQWLWERAT